jgi:hypothetical protein
LNDILEIMAYDSDSSSSSSSNEDVDMLFLDTLFNPILKMRHRLDFQALSDSEGVEMFRCVNNILTVRLFCRWHLLYKLIHGVFILFTKRFEKNDIERLCTSLRLPN